VWGTIFLFKFKDLIVLSFAVANDKFYLEAIWKQFGSTLKRSYVLR